MNRFQHCGEIEKSEVHVGSVGFHQRSGAPATVPWAYLRLPPFPQVAVRVLQPANNGKANLHQLCELISSDPAFASEVLTVSNSLLYAPRYSSATIEQAVAALGASALKGICMTVGVRAYLGNAISYPAMRNLWRHNLACAMIAQRIARAGAWDGSIDKDAAYTAGILHDVGRVALAVIQPKGYAALLEKHHGTSASMLLAEREMFGLDHCEVGRQLIADWKLPKSFEAVVADHHSDLRSGSAWNLLALVRLSCAMASAVGFAPFSGCAAAKLPELLRDLPAPERTFFHPDAETLKGEIARSILAIESF
jgi:putative nucleotidyltransferase with HDIG domain